MINFHKFGFLDVRRMQRYVIGENHWISWFNPIWLFIWSDLYKPEISFDQDICYIRFLLPELGMCYFPPLGTGDFEEAFKKIKEDCKENGFDFNIAPLDEELIYKFKDIEIDFKENEKFYQNIYTCRDLAFMKRKGAIKTFEKEHINAYYRPIKKEDFPKILEFIEAWHQEQKELKDKTFYTKLNSIKRLIEHLYELDLLGIMLCDEEHIYGVAIGSNIDNITHLYLFLSLDSIIGSKEELLSCFCKTAGVQTRYLNVEGLDLALKETYKIKPFKIEKYYSTFRL